VTQRPLSVLIVEDVEDDALLMLRHLRAGGFDPSWQRVDSAEGLAEALAARTWDLVLSDHRMPRFSSSEALRLVLETGCDAPLLLVSGSIGEEAAVAAMRAGARDWISKSNLGRLAPAVERELAEAEVRRARSLAERRLREAEERYRNLVERIPAVTFVVDEAGKVRFVSPQVAAQSGYTQDEWAEAPDRWFSLILPEDRERVANLWASALASSSPFVAEYRIRHRDGSVVWVQAEGEWAQADSGERLLQGFSTNITEHEEADAALRHAAYHDPLTDLPNGARLTEFLEEAVAEAVERGAPLAVFQIELTRTTEINNTLGRHNGDLLIQQAARLLADLPGIDLACCVGTGAFCLVARETDAERARRIAEAILRQFEQPMAVQALPVELGVNTGIAICPGHGEDAELLLRRADVALAHAQRSLDGVALYSRDKDPYDPRRLLLMGDLRNAIENDGLRLAYQPKVELRTRRLVGVEALARWRHPEYGDVRPDEFIALAEGSALIRPLTDWVLNEAFRQCSAWRRADLPLTVSVNLSARNLQDANLVERIESLLETWGLEPGWVVLELTESALMADPKRAERSLAQLDELGLVLSIDDFGTGYSSLAYLRRLPVREVKIDRSFVIGLSSEQGDLAIVRTVTDCGHHLGLQVVAEGVEDARTWDLLLDAGCDMAQGYHVARPMSPEELGGWVRRGEYGLQEPPKDPEEDA